MRPKAIINTSGLPLALAWAMAMLICQPAQSAEDTKMPLGDKEIDQRIENCRTSEVTLTVSDASGNPLAGREIAVRQVRHKFLFGCNAFCIGQIRQPGLEQEYRRLFADLLNYATLPFYWGGYEPQEGKPHVEQLKMMAQWCRDNHIRAKGHPLCWHNLPPKWLDGRTPAQVEQLEMGRIDREVAAFAGLVDTWDVVNEAVVMPTFEKGENPIAALCGRLGRAELIGECFQHARKANPKAMLVLNDFVHDKRYEELIAKCLKAGVSIDAIGLQSHMHKGYLGAATLWEVCERFAKLGKPLHFTEVTLLSGDLKTDDDWMSHHPGWETTPQGEQRQGREVREFYRLLFSHPAVEAITWWDFSDLQAWQGAPAGLVRKDMTPKPAYNVLKELVKKQWWTGPLTLKTDKDGRATFRGFLGAYEVQAGKDQGSFDLEKAGPSEVKVKLVSGH